MLSAASAIASPRDRFRLVSSREHAGVSGAQRLLSALAARSSARSAMGKRKKAKAPPKKAKPKVSTVFSCPFCGGGDTCSVKLDREHKLGTITCSACQAKYTKEITPLDEAIDVYSEWIDMCAAPRARCASPCIIASIARGCRAIPAAAAYAAHCRRAHRVCRHRRRSCALRSEEVNTAEGRGRAVDPRSAEGARRTRTSRTSAATTRGYHD